MSTVTLQQALQTAIAHHQAGELPQAEALYRQILAVQPQNADALHLLGVIANQVGRHDMAVDLIAQSIAAHPNYAPSHSNLGEAYRGLGQWDRAEASYRRALALNPNFADAWNNLGIALHEQGRIEDAVAAYRRTLALEPNNTPALNNLGLALIAVSQFDEAKDCCRRALALLPNYAAAHDTLGIALRSLGHLAEAAASHERALALQPDFPSALNNLGTVYSRQGRADDALAAYTRALALEPNNVPALSNIAIALTAKGRLDEAVDACRRALALHPDSAEASNGLGNALLDQGRVNDALDAFRQAVRLKPGDPQMHSTLVFALHCDPRSSPETLRAEHALWNTRHGAPRRVFIPRHTNTPDPDRRLKIGYVSPDMCSHAVGRFLRPLLGQHDHERFEIICYADVARPDAFTERLRDHADQWRDTFGCSEERLADWIQSDTIDILVDLALHTAGNRLPVFARKPAPVQATYLAYCSTSGLSAMDYRLTDPRLDPASLLDSAGYAEASQFLPDTYWCYEAPGNTPPQVSALPAPAAGYVTFGCLNNFAKVGPTVLHTWIRVLKTVPNSRLVLYAHAGSHRAHAHALLAGEGIDPERLRFVGHAPLADYYGRYDQIDIALDPFPFAGGTTTCDALWMGVPVVTLAGRTAVGRGGVSILSAIGLPDWVAHTEDEYVQTAALWAGDLPRLAALRAGMRERMLASPLMDAPRFTRAVEDAYRAMWQHWCLTRPA